ncbi:MAG: dimethylhistidine N-methyltransferase [Acidobacteria bacterium RIFCSPHIGHO2_12_FULL_67_30]|nr:MAG: dimethylhistidine N-methyltransferase [Acidobacteria bacterium RIFCSPHIGHO2_12_FULL_67_30]
MPDQGPQRTESIAASTAGDFAAEVAAGLTKPQKELPSKYLYDEVGSALFEVICALPEYGLARAGERLLRRHAGDIVAQLSQPVAVAELGSGTGKSTRWLLEALARRQPVTYYPIDISRAALARCERELSQIDSVSLVGFERAYLDGLLEVAARRREGEHLLVLFLGSTIGNFDRPAGEEFLRAVRRILQPGDALLLATDLEKPMPQLILAYDDPLGVTAAFNLNLLARVNRELEADFNLARFRHQARWDARARRLEMHLVSLAEQSVTLRKLGLTVGFREGETIWTESCHKYNLEEIFQMAARAGYHCRAQWVDSEWPFAQSLYVAV